MGDLLNSPALNYTLFTLADAVEQTRQLKLLQEQPEDDMDTSRTEEENKPAVSIEKQFRFTVINTAISIDLMCTILGF